MSLSIYLSIYLSVYLSNPLYTSVISQLAVRPLNDAVSDAHSHYLPTPTQYTCTHITTQLWT